MKRIGFAVIVLSILIISCVPTPTPQLQVAVATATLQVASVTATTTASPTITSTPTQTLPPTTTPTSTSTLTVTPSPKPTATPTPAITPLALSLFKYLDASKIPLDIFRREPQVIDVGDLRYGNNGWVIGEKTIMEPLPSYPGFDGAVVHVKVDSPSPTTGNQRPYVTFESIDNLPGAWAYEVSHTVLKAPSKLVHTGWQGDPIIQLVAGGYHPNNKKSVYRAFGGVRLLTDNGRDYYVSLYRVNADGTNTPNYQKVPFRLEEKQILRMEIFYDAENNNAPSIRAFLVEPSNGGDRRYVFIGKLPLDKDIPELFGFFTFLGIYTGQNVTGFEGISGEGKIYR